MLRCHLKYIFSGRQDIYFIGKVSMDKKAGLFTLTSHFSILRVSEEKFTPILKTSRLSPAVGRSLSPRSAAGPLSSSVELELHDIYIAIGFAMQGLYARSRYGTPFACTGQTGLGA